MVSLARATLRYEWRRFLPAVLAVAFSGMLVLVQLGLLLGMFTSVSVYIDESSADLWVGYRDTKSIDLAPPIPGRSEAFLRLHPEVAAVEKFNWSGGDWRRPGGGSIMCAIVGVDTREGALVFSRLLSREQRLALQRPGGVLVDEADLDKLGVAVGDAAELNGRRVTVVGTTSGLRAVGGSNIIASRQTVRDLNAALRASNEDYVAFFLVKLRHPERAELVRDELQPTGAFKPYRVWTAAELSAISQSFWLFESGAGAGVAFTSVLVLIVGLVITSQTLMAAISGSIREYATLRALGVPMRSLAGTVIEQSFWVGLLGLGVALVGAYAAQWVATVNYVSMSLPSWLALATGAVLVLIAVVSGVLALRTLSKAEPSTLLR